MEFKKHIHFSNELESAVLGICLLEKYAFGRTHGIVDEKVFYSEANREVYNAIQKLYSNNLPVDIEIVNHFLMKEGKTRLADYETPAYLTKLSRDVVSSANLEYHCYILKQLWMEREVIALTHGGIKLEGDVTRQLITLQTQIAKIKSGEYVRDWYDMSELMVELIKHQESIQRGEQVYVKTGIKELDERNGGFYDGQMIVVGARPSVGKSAFMGQLAMNIARSGKKVGIISLEMSNNEIAGRLAAIDTNIDFQSIYRGLITDERMQATFFDKISKSTANLPIYISSATKVNPMDIRAKADKLKDREGLDILFIDYLQLISAEQSGNKTRENVVSEISRSCKIMAKELNIPVVILCQLNRASTQRSGEARYPNLSDLRESGAIEQDADVVMFIHRDWAVGIETDEQGYSTQDKADILIRKWRNGESNLHLPIGFDGPRMRFDFEQRNKLSSSRPSVNYQEDNPF